jgi:hypothetical protein
MALKIGLLRYVHNTPADNIYKNFVLLNFYHRQNSGHL